jgi:hypothetical protein
MAIFRQAFRPRPHLFTSSSGFCVPIILRFFRRLGTASDII